ncbi:MAG: NifU family protein, partial [Candidatus Omnitrophica bacterium]|nr:NifU family protein [Candidatus Omnitrophota bacterium]
MLQEKKMIDIQTEFTPNPQSLKFNVSQVLLEKGSVFFASEAEAKGSPLAEKIFQVPNIKNVFIGRDFVTITRSDHSESWGPFIVPVTQAITGCLESGQPVFLSGASSEAGSKSGETEVEKRIKQVLDEYIRPAVARDGGDIVFHGFKNGVVSLYLRGACSS